MSWCEVTEVRFTLKCSELWISSRGDMVQFEHPSCQSPPHLQIFAQSVTSVYCAFSSLWLTLIP